MHGGARDSASAAQAAGVRGIRLRGDDRVVGLQVVSTNEHDLLFATARGYGKRVRVQDFRVAHRGGMGVRTIPTDKRNGNVIGLVQVSEKSNILLIDTNGKIIRLSPKEVRTMGRQAKGVRLIRLDTKQELAAIAAFVEEEEKTPEELTQDGEHFHLQAIEQLFEQYPFIDFVNSVLRVP